MREGPIDLHFDDPISDAGARVSMASWRVWLWIAGSLMLLWLLAGIRALYDTVPATRQLLTPSTEAKGALLISCRTDLNFGWSDFRSHSKRTISGEAKVAPAEPRRSIAKR
jgi:hypothetical protein